MSMDIESRFHAPIRYGRQPCQWRIYIVKFWTLSTQGQNSFNFMQFLGKFGNCILAPPPRRNPGFATAYLLCLLYDLEWWDLHSFHCLCATLSLHVLNYSFSFQFQIPGTVLIVCTILTEQLPFKHCSFINSDQSDFELMQWRSRMGLYLSIQIPILLPIYTKRQRQCNNSAMTLQNEFAAHFKVSPLISMRTGSLAEWSQCWHWRLV